MNYFNLKNYFNFLIIMLLITTYLPLVSNNLPPLIRSHHIWTPIWGISLLLFQPKVIFNKFFLFVLVFMIITVPFQFFIWPGSDEWTKRQSVFEMYQILMALSMFFYFYNTSNLHSYALAVKWTMIFVVITSIMSIYSSMIDPLYARKITGGQLEEITDVLKYGGGSFSLSSLLLCIFPLLVFYYRNNEKSILSKRILFVLIILFYVAIIRMQIFANILVASLVIIISIFGQRRLKKSLFFTVVLLIIFISIPNHFYANIFIDISKYFDSESEVYFKLNDFSQFIVSGEYEGTGSGGRAQRYPILLSGFIQSPIFGYYFDNVGYIKDIGAGAHLFWMYKLSVFGLVFFLFFTYIFYRFVRINLKIYNEEYSFYFLISVFSIIVLGLMKNLAGRDFWYFFFFALPGFYYLPLLKRN